MESDEDKRRLVDIDACWDYFAQQVYNLCEDDPDNFRANSIIDLFESLPTIDIEE